MTFYVNYITYLLVTLMSSVVRYSGHYNLILRTIQYYIPKLFILLVYNMPQSESFKRTKTTPRNPIAETLQVKNLETKKDGQQHTKK